MNPRVIHRREGRADLTDSETVLAEGASLPYVGIVLVTYYGADNLEKLYQSIRALWYPRDRLFLLVVENGPEREAEKWFQAQAPDVRVIVPGADTGYAGGSAIGMRAALSAGADYVAVLTQDAELEPLWLWELVRTAEGQPGVGAVQPKILRRCSDGPAVIHTWGNELHFLGVGYVGGDGMADRPLEVRSIAFASGTGVLYRASALERVGVSDPGLFMYHEDSDLSWRLRLAGWEVLLAPRAVMYHDYEFKSSAAKFYYVERNRLINLLTHFRLRTLAVITPALVLFEILTVLYAIREGWVGKRLAVYGFFFRAANWRYVIEKRRKVQSLRRVPDRAIAAHLTGRIEFAQLQGVLLRWFVNPLFAGYWLLVRRLISW